MKTTSPVLAFALIAMGFASGCSSSSGGGRAGTSSSGGTGTGSQAVACDLASSSDVSTALAIQNVQSPTSMQEDPVTLCTYTVTGKGEVLIRYEVDMTMSDFETGEQGFASQGMTTTPVTGLGDAAYSSTLGSGQFLTSTVVVLKGTTEVEISAPADLSAVEALAAEIVAKL